MVTNYLSESWFTVGEPSERWEHRLTLADTSRVQVSEIARKLQSEFATRGAPFRDRFRLLDATILPEIAREFFPDREFFSPNEYSHELRQQFDPASFFSTRETATQALELDIPIEFGYSSLRKNALGEKQLETHVRLIKVTNVDSVGFNGRHARGARRYNFDSVEWLHFYRGGKGAPLSFEPLIELKYTVSEEQTSFSTQVGFVGSKGILIEPPHRGRETPVLEVRQKRRLWSKLIGD